jgi:replicative DNA helicase
MSDGLRLVASILTIGASAALRDVDREALLPQEQTVYDFVLQHRRQYGELPRITTIRDELNINLPRAPEPVQFYINAIDDRHTYNRVRDHMQTLRNNMASRDIPAVRAAIGEMNSFTRITRGRAQTVHNIREGMGLVLERLEDTRGMGGITGIETGWARYDAITGGYQNADIITFVARPSVGKTYIELVQAYRAYMAGHSVLYITTEMNTEQSARRLVSIGTGVDPTRLKSNMLSTHTERRIRGFVTDLREVDRFRIFAVGMKSRVSDVEALITELQPDIVFIDGVYLLHPSVKGTMKRIERVGEVFDELKALNIAANIPFVVTTQFNRQSGKGGADGSLETIGFSDAIGTHSSIVVAIKHGAGDNAFSQREFEFMKGREGESGSIAINFKFAPLNFDEVPFDPTTNTQVIAATVPGTQDSIEWMS